LKGVLYTSIQNSGDIEQRYWEKGGQKAGTKQEIEEAHSLLRDIFAEIVVENYPINPKLTNFVARTFVESESKLAKEIQNMNLDCNSNIIDDYITKNALPVLDK